MRHYIIILVVGFLTFSHHIQSQNLEKFNAQLEKVGMTYSSIEGFTEVPPIDNPHMLYEYAIKIPSDKLEIRYAIREGQDNLQRAMLLAILMNISGEMNPTKFQIREFHPEAVRSEFNADWGGIVITDVRPDFGQDYKHCAVVFLYKEGKANAYVFFMLKSIEDFGSADFTTNFEKAFHLLKFKD